MFVHHCIGLYIIFILISIGEKFLNLNCMPYRAYILRCNGKSGDINRPTSLAMAQLRLPLTCKIRQKRSNSVSVLLLMLTKRVQYTIKSHTLAVNEAYHIRLSWQLVGNTCNSTIIHVPLFGQTGNVKENISGKTRWPTSHWFIHPYGTDLNVDKLY